MQEKKTGFKPGFLPGSGSALLPGSLFSFYFGEIWIPTWIFATQDYACQICENTLL